MPDIAKWILVGIAVAFIAFDKARAFFNSKKNGNNLKKELTAILEEMVSNRELSELQYNPHPPGESSICRENRDKIIKNEEAIENIEKSLVRIEGKINGMK